METDETVIAAADQSKQESLQSEIIPDPMDSEQPDPFSGTGDICGFNGLDTLYTVVLLS